VSVINQYLNGESVSLILFFIGAYGVAARRNILKTIISLNIMQASTVLFFITINSTSKALAPIGHTFNGTVSDPVPQALMITAIVVGISVTALSLTMFMSLYKKYGTTNWSKVKKRRRYLP